MKDPEKVIARSEAVKRGMTRYFTGKPCKYGHISQRFVAGGQCIPCMKSRQTKARANSRHLTIREAQTLFKYDKLTGQMCRRKKDGSLKPESLVNGEGYLEAKANYKCYLVHRLAFMVQGIDPAGYQVDHIDGDRTNNKWQNLRLVTSSQNNKNRSIPSTNTSGVIGVQIQEGRWLAKITHNRELIHLGSFDTIEEATLARKKAEIKYGFHENHGRPLNGEASTCVY